MARYSFGPGSLRLSKSRTHEQLTNAERKKRGLPHDGAKQAEKDRRRGYYEETHFGKVFERDDSLVIEPRTSPIVCRLPSE